jgi:glycosyltransferase involved in cell wall biosynthesis
LAVSISSEEELGERMDIVHIITTFVYKSGSARRTYRILRAMVDNGYRVGLIIGRTAEMESAWDFTGIRVIQIGELVKYRDVWADFRAMVRIVQTLSEIRPKVVHTHLAKGGVLGRLAAWICRVPIIIHTVHGPTFPEALSAVAKVLYKVLERLVGGATDHFVFVGEELRQEYLSAGICREENSVVIRSGRGVDEFEGVCSIPVEETGKLREMFGLGAELFLMGHVGRIVPSKGQDVSLEVLRGLRARGVDAHLVFIGEAHLPEERYFEQLVRRRAEQLGLSEYAHFLGYRSDVLKYMKAMDVIILPSQYEGLPNVVIEAGVVGKAVIAFDVCGIREVIEDSVSGFVTLRGDINGMIERTHYLSAHRAVAAKMGKEAAAKVREVYTAERMIKDKVRFYKDVLGDSRISCGC